MSRTLASVVDHARKALNSIGEPRGNPSPTLPRFELFHAANSICSQKVRAVMAHHRLAYVGHTLKLFVGETYLPDYVRMRMVGCESFGGALVSHHDGNTSASAGGCDGAVVPTLIDWQNEEVVVDSRAICSHLDRQMSEQERLSPQDLADEIESNLAIVDNLPNYQILMGRTPSASEDANVQGGVGGQFSQRKVAWCDRYLLECADDASLTAAYTAKRAKELSAASELFSTDAMARAYGQAETALFNLDRLLARREHAWLFGEAVTMADLFWGVELLRMKNLGLSSMWREGKLAQVEQFSDATAALPALCEAVIDWPGAMF